MQLFNFNSHASGSIFTVEATRATRRNWIIHQVTTFYYHTRMLSKQASRSLHKYEEGPRLNFSPGVSSATNIAFKPGQTPTRSPAAAIFKFICKSIGSAASKLQFM
jgi:hypothetical protein